jgi:RimJ/RimL family protein N-acetyltransferase
MIVRIASLDDLEGVVDHNIRQMREPGFNGLLAHPFSRNHPFEKAKMLEKKLASWTTELTDPHWSRSFVLIENEKIVGDLSLKNLFHGTLHRAELGMGVEEPMRGKGAGKLLLKTAINWALEQSFLEWIDLSVFSHNTPARKLYKSFGFVELCTIKDLIRVDETSIDDIKMVLKLK